MFARHSNFLDKNLFSTELKDEIFSILQNPTEENCRVNQEESNDFYLAEFPSSSFKY